MGAKLEKVKTNAKKITWFVIGLIYFPIYLFFWLLRIVARLLLAISHIMTFNSRHGIAILKSVFNRDYERTF